MKNTDTKQKKKRFNIFDSQKEGKGVEKGEVKKPTFINFFKYYFRSITRVLNTNLMFTLFCLPLFSFFFGVAGFFDKFTYGASSLLYAPVLSEIELGNINPTTLSLYGALCHRTESLREFAPVTIVFFALTALIIFTWGYANSGMFYVMRNMQRGEPVFMFADFKQTIKKNKFSALILGILDLIIMFMLVYNLEFYRINASIYFYSVMFYITIFLMLLYVVMRFYIYLLLVTFDLKTFKIFKNAFIFAFIGFKRNIPALIGVLLVIFLNIFIFFAFRPIGIILPFVLTVGTISYIATYAAYPKIKEIMIDPYFGSEQAEENDTSEIESGEENFDE